MIATKIAVDAFRILTPEWSHQPLSGAGAAREGGRFNRKDQHAVYLALDTETAIAEYRQAEQALRPGTIAQYRVEIAGCVDFAAGYQAHGSFDPLWEDWSTAWNRLAFIDGIEPPTWLMADEVVASGYAALLFPSTKRPGGVNLVVYTGQLQPSDVFRVHDPDAMLPRNQASWRT